jgi:hypothetical protein
MNNGYEFGDTYDPAILVFGSGVQRGGLALSIRPG